MCDRQSISLLRRDRLRLLQHLLGAVLWLLAMPVAAVAVDAPHVALELVAERATFEPGRPLTVALRMILADGWHTYWRNPGDSGLPVRIAWRLPAGFSVGPIQWPPPARIDAGPLTSFGYDGEVLLLNQVEVPPALARGSDVAIGSRIDWVVCRESCIPGHAELALRIPVSGDSASPAAPWAEAIARARDLLPRPLTDWRASAYREAPDLVLRLEREDTRAPDLRRLAFFPYHDGWVVNSAPQRMTASTHGYEMRVEAAATIGLMVNPLEGLLVFEPASGQGDAAAEVRVHVTDGPPAAVVGTDHPGARRY